MDRIFLDANVLFSAAYREGAGLMRLWKLDAVALLTSGYAIEEARRNLTRADQHIRLDDLLMEVICVAESPDQPTIPGIVLPAKDLPILHAAVAANCTHLLTGDVAHFGKYFGETRSGIMIQPPGDYLRLRMRP